MASRKRTNTGARRLRDWLAEQSVSQSELARRLGVSQPAVSLLVRGLRRPSLQLAAKLETLTGISPVAWVSN